MKVLKTLFFTLLMCAFAVSGWAFSPAWDVNAYYDQANFAETATHIKQAPNGKGDVLIYPFRLDATDLSAKFTIANTSTTQSTVAKFVVRSDKFSGELLDFLIYLSPADVWTGKLYTDANGTTKIYSEDDSVIVDATGEWASPDNPMDQPLNLQELEADFGEDPMLGYVTVINLVASSGHKGFASALGADERSVLTEWVQDQDINARPVDKSAIKTWYGSLDANFERTAQTGVNGTINENYDAKAFDKNILSGWMDYRIDDTFIAKVGATTLRDHRQLEWVNDNDFTFLGNVYDPTPNASGFQSLTELGQLEAALAKDEIVMPYQNKPSAFSVHFFTFPSKYSFIWKFPFNDNDSYVLSISPYFNANGEWRMDTLDTPQGFKNLFELCVPYGATNLNLKEQTPNPSPFSPPAGGPAFCDELNLVIPTPPYEEGVAHYNFDNETTVPYTVDALINDWIDDFVSDLTLYPRLPFGSLTSFPEVSYVDDTVDNGEYVYEDKSYDAFTFTGAPVIPSFIDVFFDSANDEAFGMAMAYGSWSDGDVTVTEDGIARRIPFYQYADDLDLLEGQVPYVVDPTNPNYMQSY